MVANELCWFLRDQNKFMCWKVVLHAINHWVVSTLVQSSFLNSEKIKRNPFIFQNKIRAMLKDKKVWMGKTTVVDCLLEQIALQFLIWSAIQTLRYNALSLSLKKVLYILLVCLLDHLYQATCGVGFIILILNLVQFILSSISYI